MSDDGSEIDSKYNIHPSFVIVIWFEAVVRACYGAYFVAHVFK